MLLMLAFSNAWASSSWSYLTDVQSGGLMGVAHVNAVAQSENGHEFNLGAGFVPKMSDHREMGLLSLGYGYQGDTRLEFRDAPGYALKPWYFGAGFLYGDHDELFLSLPDQYPSGYYAPTALRILFHYRMTLETPSRWQFYMALTALDVGVISYIREPDFFYDNYEFLGLSGITNLGFGARYRF